MSKTNEKVLKAFLQQTDSDRYSSQDICDMMRDTISLTPDEVTKYMMDNGWVPWRKDERLVWHKIDS